MAMKNNSEVVEKSGYDNPLAVDSTSPPSYSSSPPSYSALPPGYATAYTGNNLKPAVVQQPHIGQKPPYYVQGWQGQPQIVYITPPPPLANPPKDFLVFAILVTVLCCWPIGICAIVSSVNCRTAIAKSSREEAESSSKWALGLSIASLISGIVIIIIIICVIVIPAQRTVYTYNYWG